MCAQRPQRCCVLCPARCMLLRPRFVMMSVTIYLCLLFLPSRLNVRGSRSSASGGAACTPFGCVPLLGPRLSLFESHERSVDTSDVASAASHEASKLRVLRGSTSRATRDGRTHHHSRCTPSAGAPVEQGPASGTYCRAARQPALRQAPQGSPDRLPCIYFSGDHQRTHCEREGGRTCVAAHTSSQTASRPHRERA